MGVGSTMLHMVHKEELWFLRVHWIGLKSGRCSQESKAIHIFKYLPSTLSRIFQYNFMPRPFLDTYMVAHNIIKHSKVLPLCIWKHLPSRRFLHRLKDPFAGHMQTFPLWTRGVSHYGLAIYIKKYIKAKEEVWKLKYFTMQKYNLQKILWKKPKSFKVL